MAGSFLIIKFEGLKWVESMIFMSEEIEKNKDEEIRRKI